MLIEPIAWAPGPAPRLLAEAWALAMTSPLMITSPKRRVGVDEGAGKSRTVAFADGIGAGAHSAVHVDMVVVGQQHDIGAGMGKASANVLEGRGGRLDIAADDQAVIGQQIDRRIGLGVRMARVVDVGKDPQVMANVDAAGS